MFFNLELAVLFLSTQVIVARCAVIQVRPRMLTRNWDLDILFEKVCESDECALEDKPSESDEIDIDHEENFLSELDESDREKQRIVFNHLSMMERIMDRSVDPCENFYQYACGNYENVQTIPSHKKIYNIFDHLLDKLLHNLREVLESKESGTKSWFNIRGFATSVDDKARALYRSCMDAEAIKQSGLSPLLTYIQSLGGWPVLKGKMGNDDSNWIGLAAELGRVDFNFLFKQSIEIERRRSNEYMIRLDQTTTTTLTLDHDNHVNATQIAKYKKFVANILDLLGASAEIVYELSAEIVDFEEAIALIPALESDNSSKIIKIADLQREFPGIHLPEYFHLVYGDRLQKAKEVVLYSENYFRQLSELIVDTEPRVVVNYIFWKLTELYFIILGKNFDDYESDLVDDIFEVNSWLECASLTTNSLEEIVRQMYMDRFFNETNKHDVTAIADDLHEAFAQMIKDSEWLDTFTKNTLQDKLNALNLQIGYADSTLTKDQLERDYRELELSPEQYFANIIRINKFSVKKGQALVGEKYSDREIPMNFMSTTAHYKFSKNAAVIPAALLQPPLYHIYYPMPLKFGVVGALIAHEITHGFSGKGRLFDQSGRKQTLWTNNSGRGYDKRTQCFIQQYSNYTFNGHPVNGTSSAGENICDNNGLRMSYRAFKKWLQQNGNSATIWSNDIHPDINVTNSQLFFLSFAQFMCTRVKPEGVATFINAARHPPPEIRIIGTLSNLPEFGEEFSCRRGSPMNPIKKCRMF